MTKIKDLAYVITDNAFLMFPIDVERYELRNVLDHITSPRHLCRDFVLDTPLGNERISSFIRAADSLLVDCAKCFGSVQNSPGLRSSRLTRDRARRCEATLRNWCSADVRWSKLKCAVPEVLVYYLWEAVMRCIDATEAKYV
jgi:hypothetical protein